MIAQGRPDADGYQHCDEENDSAHGLVHGANVLSRRDDVTKNQRASVQGREDGFVKDFPGEMGDCDGGFALVMLGIAEEVDFALWLNAFELQEGASGLIAPFVDGHAGHE